ncbi:MAG TPA: tetratricopeptide repeat protein [Ktedonobacteraceae bacterium]
MHNEQSAAIGQGISGLGGVGKTQLAVEYAYRFRQEYQAVLWATAESVETLNASYVELAAQLKLPERDAQEQEAIVQAVKDWLRTHHAWLLILDNADQPELLAPFLPPLVGGHILVTTRAAVLSSLDLGIAQPLPLDTFTREQGAYFLLRRAGLLARAGEQEHTLARQISEELGDLPLALDQAGAYLETTGTSLDTYILIYRQRCNELLAQRRGRSHPAPIAATWSLSVQRVEQTTPAAAELLRFCAFLAPDAIPEELFSAGARHLGPILAPVAADSYRLNEAIAALRAYSLINRDPQERTLSVHRLVQFVLRQMMDTGRRGQWERRAVLALQATFPLDDFENWPLCERLMPHILLYAVWEGQTQRASLTAASLALHAGCYLLTRARYQEAEQLLSHSLGTRQRLLGAEHPDVAESLKRQGMLALRQGKYKEAEPLLLRALALTQKIYGPDHPTSASGLNNLALLYSEQGRYAQSEEFHRRALTICTRALGQEDPAVVSYLNNLAACYTRQDRLEDARPLFLRALAIAEKHLGPEHPEVASGLINLASVYSRQGHFKEAEALFLRALAIAEKHLGPEHPEVAAGLVNLADVSAKQGRSRDAEKYYRQALALYERVLGTEHPHTRSARQRYIRLLQVAENKVRASDTPHAPS